GESVLGPLIRLGCRCAGTTAYGSVGYSRELLASGPASSRRRAARAVAVSHRRSGSFSNSPYSTSVNGPARSGGGGGSSTTACMVAIGSPSSNGGRPSTAAYMVTPRENRSLAEIGGASCRERVD